MSSTIQTVVTIAGVVVGILYILSIVYVIKDARNRGTNWPVWAIISLIPLIGFIAYCVARPPLTIEDRDEQDLDVALKRRQLMQYGTCAHCGYPVENDYVLCPNCHQRLKNLCPTCHHALNPEWSICPYCTTTIHRGAPRDPQGTGAVRTCERRTSADTTGQRPRVN